MNEATKRVSPRAFKVKAGDVFCRWTVIMDGAGRAFCRCECGTIKKVSVPTLVHGTSRSCGCLKSDIQAHLKTVHGRSGSRVYDIWRAMINRCYSTNHIHFGSYGGRGISVCGRWLSSIEAFIEDMGIPESHHTIDRIDNDGNYEPGNCRWATHGQQCLNKRNNRILEAFGRRQTMVEWAREYGIRPGTLRERLSRNIPVEDAITRAVGKYSKPPLRESQ